MSKDPTLAGETLARAERHQFSDSPYTRSILHASELGLSGIDVHVAVEDWTAPGADNIELARSQFDTYGASILSPSLRLVDSNETVASVTGRAIRGTVELLDTLVDDHDIVRPKDFEAYNGTGRQLSTVSFPNVMEHFPPVVAFQNELLPTIRAINGDPTTEVSIDPDEGTVINLQLFREDGNPDDKQQHGAHIDRVDTTAVFCLDNVGDNGDLVFAVGYYEACVKLGLNEHGDFNSNVTKILTDDPTAITFRRHHLNGGDIIVLQSASFYHFITAKTLRDVKDGMDRGHEPYRIGSGQKIIGRTIGNVAYETGRCRGINEKSLVVEEVIAARIAALGSKPSAAVRGTVINETIIDMVLPEERREVGNAVFGRLSANDLYL